MERSRSRTLRLSAILLLLALLGTTTAQNWVGLRTGYPLGVTLHYGIDDALSAGVDGRVSANLRVRGGDVDFGVGFDALQTVSVERPFSLYVGGGPAVDFGRGGTLIELHGLAGAEFSLSDVELERLGVFAEVSLGAAIGIGRDSYFPAFGGGLGFNYRF